MIEHIGILKFEPFTRKDQKDLVITKLKKLVEVIPSIVEIQVGYNFSEKNQGFDIGISARFENRKDLDDFLYHPSHQEVGAFAKEVGLIDIITVDFLV